MKPIVNPFDPTVHDVHRYRFFADVPAGLWDLVQDRAQTGGLDESAIVAAALRLYLSPGPTVANETWLLASCGHTYHAWWYHKGFPPADDRARMAAVLQCEPCPSCAAVERLQRAADAAARTFVCASCGQKRPWREAVTMPAGGDPEATEGLCVACATAESEAAR